MGAKISIAEQSRDSLILSKGSTFLYSVANPVSKINSYNGNESQSCSGSQTTRLHPFMIYSPCSEQYKTQNPKLEHLIYEGTVFAPYTASNGKIVYAYQLRKVTASPDPFNPAARGSISWTLEGSGWTDSEKLQYVGTTGKSDEPGGPPLILTTSAKAGYPANNDGKYSLIPKYIPSDDPNLGINGEFGRMTKQQIYKALNAHAINTSLFAELERAEVVEKAAEYKVLTLTQIKQMALKVIGVTRFYLDTKYTLNYTKRSNGITMNETINRSEFITKGPTVFDSPDKDRILNYIKIDEGANYENEFESEIISIQEYRKQLVKKFSGDKIIMKNIRIDGTAITGRVNMTDIPLVNPKYTMNTDSIFDDAGFITLLRKIGSTDTPVAAWTQEIVTEGGKNIIKTTFYSHYADEDIIADTRSVPSPIPGSSIMKYISGIIPPAARDGKNLFQVIGKQSASISAAQSTGVKYARRKDINELLKSLEDGRISLLGLLRALIEKDYTIGGTAGAVNIALNKDSVDNANWARYMFLLSEVYRVHIEAIKKAMESRSKVFGSGPAYLTEAFQTNTSVEEAQISNAEESKYITGLRSALDKNTDIADRISHASTEATTNFISFIVASGIFVALATYPVFTQS